MSSPLLVEAFLAPLIAELALVPPLPIDVLKAEPAFAVIAVEEPAFLPATPTETLPPLDNTLLNTEKNPLASPLIVTVVERGTDNCWSTKVIALSNADLLALILGVAVKLFNAVACALALFTFATNWPSLICTPTIATIPFNDINAIFVTAICIIFCPNVASNVDT